jgi:hypothetical protein
MGEKDWGFEPEGTEETEGEIAKYGKDETNGTHGTYETEGNRASLSAPPLPDA